MITAERPRATHRPCFLGTVPAKEPLAVSATDAPFPAEHEEQTTRTGERLHLCWIPETSSERYVNGSSAAYCPGTPPQAVREPTPHPAKAEHQCPALQPEGLHRRRVPHARH